MQSLIKTRYNSIAVIIIAAFIWFSFPALSVFRLIAITLTVHQFVLLFNAIGHVVPIRYLFGVFMCLQFFVGPTFAYSGIDEFQFPLYRMQVTEEKYFSYAIPAVLSFIIGLHITAKDLIGEYIDIPSVEQFISKNKMLPYIFIGIGFFASIGAEFLPMSIAFILFIIGGFKFAGLYMLVIGYKKLQVLPLVAVFAFIISSSLGEGMFHDLLTWLIFTGAVIFVKFRPSVLLKVAMCLAFITLSIIIQQVKNDFRASLGTGKEGGMETLSDAYYSKQGSKGVFSVEGLAPSNVRINQGFIITYIMRRVPAKVPYANGGELYLLLEAAFLPRIIAPNKLEAGDRSIFMKYTGIPLGGNTSMGLSSLGDAYINFGLFGGCMMMFLLGLGYSEVIKMFHKHSFTFPVVILFSPLIFYFPIRPDSELQTLLGHVVKSCFLLFLLFKFSGDYFKKKAENQSIISNSTES